MLVEKKKKSLLCGKNVRMFLIKEKTQEDLEGLTVIKNT